MSAKCQVATCQNRAVALPVLMVYANRKRYPDQPPARSRMSVPHCEAHQAAAELDNLCPPEAFVMIRAGFLAAGLAEPDPDIELEWEPLPICSTSGCEEEAISEFFLVWADAKQAAKIACCAEHIGNFRRLQLEHNLTAEVQEIELVAPELRRWP